MSKINQPSEEGIAIIGMGCYYPQAQGFDQFWKNIINKIYSITDIPKGRWDPALYYDPDKTAPDKTYSKIGGFVDDIDFSVITKKYKIPPKVVTAMDRAQRFALLATGDALADAGYATREFDRSRTAVIIGNSMGGDKIDYTNLRIFMGDIGKNLRDSEIFSKIDPKTQKQILEEFEKNLKSGLPIVTEDTMPGELANVIAGRIANALNLTGPSFSVDAACASSMASLKESVSGLRSHNFDMAVAGGSDFLMGPGPYIKFCKIGALSADGSCPFDAKANGFVMGEGTGIFILKRVSDARKDGDKIYAVIRGVGAASDGKGKGITAPNPGGQALAVKRAYEDAGYGPETIQYVEAHGTSTIVGDLAESEGLMKVWGNLGLKNDSIGLGSIKSNIGHLKAAAGSAAIVKLSLALKNKILPPSLNYNTPNPNIPFGKIPFRVVTDAQDWPAGIDGNPRRAGASAFGFGGTNFHLTLEEDAGNNGMPSPKRYYQGADVPESTAAAISMKETSQSDAAQSSILLKEQADPARYGMSEINSKTLKGEAIVIGGSSWNDIKNKLNELSKELKENTNPDLRDIAKKFNMQSNSGDCRLGISASGIQDMLEKIPDAFDGIDNVKKRMVLKNKGLFYGENLLEKKKNHPKLGMLFPGQGAQYANMLKDLYNKYNVVRDTFEEADSIMHDIIGKGLSEIIFLRDDASDEEKINTEYQLKQTAITQPGVLTADYAIYRLLRSFGIIPDAVAGHSLGEYGALLAAGVLNFRDALKAVSARGREISSVKNDDTGKMVSIQGTVEKAEEVLKGIQGYAIIANKNCHSQTVVAGDSPTILKVIEKCNVLGVPAQEIAVSHAFHSKIVAPACGPYRKAIENLTFNSPKIDILANLTGDYYHRGGNVSQKILDILVDHIANPVEFIKQIERMYADGVTTFVEAGPKKTLSTFTQNILDKKSHSAIGTNHPKAGGISTFNDALAAIACEGFDVNWNGIDENSNKKDNPDWRLRKKFLGKIEAVKNLQPASVSSSGILLKEQADPSRYGLSAENSETLKGEPVVIGGSSWKDIKKTLNDLAAEIKGNGRMTLMDVAARFNMQSNSQDYRLGIAADNIQDLLAKLPTAAEGFENLKKRMVLKNKGLFYGEALADKKKNLPKVAVLFPGQGSQYINMLKDLYNKYDIVRQTFEEADAVMEKIIGKGISDIIFLRDDAGDTEVKNADELLMQAEIMQPGVLTADYAMFRLLSSFGIMPDVMAGHSLGEYGALIAAGVLSFSDALYAVSARGKEIANIQFKDTGKMVSIPGPIERTEEILKGIDGYAIIANKNCHSQTVVSGESASILKVIEKCEAAGIPAQEIPVSHAFHSNILAPACPAYRKVIESLKISAPRIDIVANLTGDYYPKDANAKQQIIDMLVQHIANPVEFIKQIERMYADGVKIFVEAGPRRTLSSFVLNILDKRPHLAMATNHPKRGGIGTLNDVLVAMSCSGFDINWNGIDENKNQKQNPEWRFRNKFLGRPETAVHVEQKREILSIQQRPVQYEDIPVRDLSNITAEGIFADFSAKQTTLMKEMLEIYSKKSDELLKEQLRDSLYYKKQVERYHINFEKVMISGISMGLPGQSYSVFGDDVFDRIIKGINLIDSVSDDLRNKMVEKNITRLVKTGEGEASFESIKDTSDVVKLAARKGKFIFEDEYGYDEEYTSRLEITSKLAIAAGIEALKDAGIPLVMNFKRTTTGKLLPAFWGLPENLQNDTGIIFVSAFPGHNALIEEVSKGVAYKYARKSKRELIKLYTTLIEKIKDEKVREQLSDWYSENYAMLKDVAAEDDVYQFNRKFLFRILAMGHSQFAELIKAKGPNIHMNVACSSTTAAVGVAEDWIRTGRAKRIIIVGADDVTSDAFAEWILSGFLAVGAVSTKENIADAAIPFDKRRNGMLVGMGAVGIIIEAESELKKRGMEPIVEVISTEFLNSAFHGTRLDVNHIPQVMEKVVSKAEERLGISRHDFAKDMIFMSHETYTPARGGSASAEIASLRKTFGESCKNIVISNTKGFTGHAMAVGIEDAVVVKALQTGKVPPIANHREVDPELGELNLSKGKNENYEHVKYGLRLGAGFGSQIAMSIVKLVSRRENRVTDNQVYKQWLGNMSGIHNPELEIVHRTLRVKDDGTILKKDRETTAITSPKIEHPKEIKSAIQKPVVQEVKAAPAPAVSGDDVIRKRILEIVGEKTGYPADLIEFDLDMESDLGIDTVKQAEMFGLIRDAFDIPKDETIKIKNFPTLNHVIGFVKKSSPHKFDSVQVQHVQTPAASSQTVQTVSAGGDDIIKKKILEIVGEKTGYPADLIEFDLDMESDLGIDTVKQAEMFGLIRDAFDIPKDETIKIKNFPTLNHVIGFVKKSSPHKFESVQVQHVQAPAASSQTVQTVSAGGDDIIRKKIVKIVEEKTGYPEDLIEFDLDMESDLGIDTVKQAEMFALIRDAFDIPKDETIKIKDFPTLNHVIGFVRERSPQKFDTALVQSAAPAKVHAKDESAASSSSVSGIDVEIKKKIVQIVEEKTGYPEDLIEFDLDMESDLGIDTVKQAEMFGMIRDRFDIPKDESIKIKDFPTLNHVVQFVINRSPLVQKDTQPASTQQKPAAQSITVSAGGISDEIRKKIVQIVEEKTGYPEDLIEFDLDMESDLGIDTVKQAEMFGLIREAFNISKDETIKIKDFPTLNHVIEFVKSKSPKSADTAEQAQIKQTEQKEVPLTKESKIRRMTTEFIEQAIDKKDNPAFNMEGYNVIITDDGKGISKSLTKILTDNKANYQILNLAELLDENKLNAAISKVKESGKINAVIHLAPMMSSKNIDSLSFDEWKAETFKKVKSLFIIVKAVQKDLADNGKNGRAFIAAATEMGGTFGFEEFLDETPVNGGVIGLVKAINKEMEDVIVKAVDFSRDFKPANIAKTIIEEVQFGGRRVEVGYRGKARLVPQVIYSDILKESKSAIKIDDESVIVIVGGGYGITSEVAKDIASNFKSNIVLISRKGLPPNIKELASLDDNGLKDLKNKVVAELKKSHERVTPVMIENEFGKYTTAIEKYKNMLKMQDLGAKSVEYLECDVMDHGKLSGTIQKIREKYGRIDGIINGAGIEQSKLMEEKKYEDFSRVFDVKADGCYNLIELTKKDKVGFHVIFSSIVGRFGNIGQTDYSAANELLNKYAQHVNKRFKGSVKTVSIGWSGWDEVGMATRGSVKQIFEQAGIELIKVEQGSTVVREEILFGNASEILIAGGLGYIDNDKIVAGDRTKEFLKLDGYVKANRNKYPMINEVISYSPGHKITVRKNLDTKTDLYLADHAIENIPYLPAVMGIESFAEAANLLFNDRQIKVMKDIRFFVPVKILRDKAVDLIISVEKVKSEGKDIQLKARLETEFFNKDGIKLGDNKLHFEADIILSEKGSDLKNIKIDKIKMNIIEKYKKEGSSIINGKEIYKRFFHGPRFQVHGGVIDIDDKMVYGVVSDINGKRGKKFSFTKEENFITNPMAIEAAFQNAGLYAMKNKNRMSLPDTVRELVFTRIPADVEGLFVRAKYIGTADMKDEYDTEVIDGNGNIYSVMKGYKMVTTGELKEDEKF